MSPKRPKWRCSRTSVARSSDHSWALLAPTYDLDGNISRVWQYVCIRRYCAACTSYFVIGRSRAAPIKLLQEFRYTHRLLRLLDRFCIDTHDTRFSRPQLSVISGTLREHHCSPRSSAAAEELPPAASHLASVSITTSLAARSRRTHASTLKAATRSHVSPRGPLRLAISVEDLPSYVPHDKNTPKLPLRLRFRPQHAPLELFEPRHALVFHKGVFALLPASQAHQRVYGFAIV